MSMLMYRQAMKGSVAKRFQYTKHSFSDTDRARLLICSAMSAEIGSNMMTKNPHMLTALLIVPHSSSSPRRSRIHSVRSTSCMLPNTLRKKACPRSRPLRRTSSVTNVTVTRHTVTRETSYDQHIVGVMSTAQVCCHC
jgi:hypothetical protein